jgi:conjugative transfer signal peptidase TraF
MRTGTRAAPPQRGRWLSSVRDVWRMAWPLAVLGACWIAGLRLNLTGSLPVGLYLVTRAAPDRGALVLVCLPVAVAAFAKVRGYVPQGGSCPDGLVPVGKRVFALPGDTVTVTPTGLFVDATRALNSRPLDVDHQGRPLPRLAAGRYVVRPGTLWIVSSYSRLSFDSRYFGAIETASVQAHVRRVWAKATP